MKRFILLAVFAMAFTLVRAQINSSLTVMTDDGQRFYLFLGGKLINSSPENNMKVQQLRERYYSCKIIFEDKALRDIRLKCLWLMPIISTPLSKLCTGYKETRRAKEN
jgi:hypothetical protein